MKRTRYIPILCAVLAVALLVQCSTSKKKVDSAPAAALVTPKIPAPKLAGAETVTSVGRNFDGVYSSDGSHIAYISEGRSPNGSSQVFEINLKTHRDRQVSFQDGLAASPRFVTGTNDLVYCSNSDEMKEKIELHHIMESLGGGKAGSPSFSPTRMELYLHEGTGARVLRLTTNPGYDCDVAMDPKHKRFVYVTETEGKFRLARLDLSPMRHEILKPRKFCTWHSPAYSPDGKNLVWAQGDSDSALQLEFGSADGHLLKPLTTVAAVNWQATFSPDGNWLVFSSNRPSITAPGTKPSEMNPTTDATPAGTKQFALYAMSLQKNCLVQLTHYESGDDSYPYFSPDGGRILFTHATQAQSHLFTLPFSEPATCDSDSP